MGMDSFNSLHTNEKTNLMNNDVFIDMDGVLCDFVKKAIHCLGGEIAPEGTPERKKQIDDCQTIPNFYRDLEPIQDAIVSYRFISERFNTFILSAPSWDNPGSFTDKRLWVGDHLGEHAHKKLILTHDKGLFTGRALIDDRIKYGVDKFKGEHIHFGNEKFPDWKSVLAYLFPDDESWKNLFPIPNEAKIVSINDRSHLYKGILGRKME